MRPASLVAFWLLVTTTLTAADAASPDAGACVGSGVGIPLPVGFGP